MTLAEKELGLTIEQRPIDLRKEIGDFEEVAACGTAAVVSPVGRIWLDSKWHTFFSGGEQAGPTMIKLYELLVGIQRGELPDSYGWTHEVPMD